MDATEKQKHRESIKTSKPLVAVLKDLDNAYEYYTKILQYFSFQGEEYVAMAPFEPDDGEHRPPNIIIMRSRVSEDGIQYFESIKEGLELENAFDAFFQLLETQIPSVEAQVLRVRQDHFNS